MSWALRVTAAALLAGAMWAGRPLRYDRVLIIELDGFSRRTLQEFSTQAPWLAARLEHLQIEEFPGPVVGLGDAFARFVFTGAPWPASAVTPFWETPALEPRHVVIAGVPGVAGDRHVSALPLADPLDGFLGSDAGYVVNVRTLASGRVPWPYSERAEWLAHLGSTLAPRQASEWLRIETAVPPPRTGMMRLYRLDAETVYLSPVYRVVPIPKEVTGVYIAADPSPLVESSRIGEFFGRHARDVTETRWRAAHAVALDRDWDVFVYRDSLLALVNQALAVDGHVAAGVAEDRRAEAVAQVDRRVAALCHAGGERAACVFVWLERGAEAAEPARALVAHPLRRALRGRQANPTAWLATLAAAALGETAPDLTRVSPGDGIGARGEGFNAPTLVGSSLVRGSAELSASFGGEADDSSAARR